MSYLVFTDVRSDLDESDDGYDEEGDDFEDEEALGIQVLDDDEEDDYDDEKFEQVFEEAEDLRRINTSASNRPISKKYVQTPGSSRRLESSHIDKKFLVDESKEPEDFETMNEIKEEPERITEEKDTTKDISQNLAEINKPSINNQKTEKAKTEKSKPSKNAPEPKKHQITQKKPAPTQPKKQQPTKTTKPKPQKSLPKVTSPS